MSIQIRGVFFTFTMKTRLSPAFCICALILILLPLTLSTSPAVDSLRTRRLPPCPANRTKLFWKAPSCEPGGTGGVGGKRKVQLYSRTSARFVQIRKTEVDARGRNGSQYARLVMETENFDRVTIRGENTNRHLCMNKKGKLVTRVRKQQFAAMKQCQFSEEFSKGYYQYRSVMYPQWFIGFSHKGGARNGRKSAERLKHRYRQFMRYDVSDKTRRNRRWNPNHRKKKLIKLLQRSLDRWNK
ncbi:hypothetical protein ACROYT_G006076 [Oculina patagonica]